MKKILSLCLMNVLLLTAAAQQKPYYTQYILNNYLINPAIAGIESYIDVKASYRNQWSGIDGAPVSTYLSIQGPLGHSDVVRQTATSFSRNGANMTGKGNVDGVVSNDQHSGAGLIIMNDKTGYINRFSFYGSYAYHKPINSNTSLALGFRAGFNSVSIDKTKITWEDDFPENDAAIDGGASSKLLPELGAGLWLYSKDYFVGLSALNIIPGKAKFGLDSSKYGSSYSPHFFASAGYKFYNDGGDLSVLPSVTFQAISPYPVQIHANVKLQVQDIFWIGGSYRFSDQLGGFAGMLGFNISNTFNLGYSYDAATTSRLRTFAGNTHEIVLGFLLNNKYGDSCPRNIW